MILNFSFLAYEILLKLYLRTAGENSVSQQAALHRKDLANPCENNPRGRHQDHVKYSLTSLWGGFTFFTREDYMRFSIARIMIS